LKFLAISFLAISCAACATKTPASVPVSSQWVSASPDLRIELLRLDLELHATGLERRLSARVSASGDGDEGLGGSAFLRAGPRWEPLEAKGDLAGGAQQERLEPDGEGGLRHITVMDGAEIPGLPVDVGGLFSPENLPGLAFAVCELSGAAPVLRPLFMGANYRISPRVATALHGSGGALVSHVTLGMEGGLGGDGDTEYWCIGRQPVAARTRAGWEYDVREVALVRTLSTAGTATESAVDSQE